MPCLPTMKTNEVDFVTTCRARLEDGDAPGATLALQEYLVTEQRNEGAWSLLAECVFVLGDGRMAAEILETAARQLTSPSLALSAAKRWTALGKPRLGRELLRHFVLIEAGDLALYCKLAACDMQEERWPDANLCLAKALELAPEDETLFSDYVGTALFIGKAGRALEWWPRFSDNTKDASVLANMAVLFLRSGDLETTQALLTRVSSSRHPNVVANFGWLAYKRGDFATASRHWISAADLGSSDIKSIVLALALGGREIEAAEWLDRLEPSPWNKALSYLLEAPQAKKLCAMLAAEQPDATAWLTQTRGFLEERRDAFARLAVLYLLEAWRYRTSRNEPSAMEFVAQAFPPREFISLLGAPESDSNVLSLAFSVFRLDEISRDKKAATRLFLDYFLPAIKHLLEAGKWSKALVTSSFSSFYVSADPKPERFHQWIGSLCKLFDAAPVARPQRAKPRLPINRPLRIAYLVDHFMHDEAPDHVLIGLVGALRASGKAIPVVIACGTASETVGLRLAEKGVELLVSPRDISTHQPDGVLFSREWLGREIGRLNIDVAVFFGSLPGTCALLCPWLPVAVCLYDSVAHTGMRLSCIDGYLRASYPISSSLALHNGVEWWLYQNSHQAIDPSPRQITLATSIRMAIFQERTVLGVIARATKLTDEFLDALTEILTARPQAVFVWTDFFPDPQLVIKLRKCGIEKQCHYAGYVDHVAWAEVLDIHLDPFPFASGLTMRQTLHRGRAYVMMAGHYQSLDGEEKVNALALSETSIEPLLALPEEHLARRRALEIFEEDLRYLAVANSAHDYVDWTIRLIDNPALRTAVGKAAHAYSDAFLTNMSEVAETHLEGIRYFLQKKYGLSMDS